MGEKTSKSSTSPRHTVQGISEIDLQMQHSLSLPNDSSIMEKFQILVLQRQILVLQRPINLSYKMKVFKHMVTIITMYKSPTQSFVRITAQNLWTWHIQSLEEQAKKKIFHLLQPTKNNIPLCEISRNKNKKSTLFPTFQGPCMEPEIPPLSPCF